MKPAHRRWIEQDAKGEWWVCTNDTPRHKHRRFKTKREAEMCECGLRDMVVLYPERYTTPLINGAAKPKNMDAVFIVTAQAVTTQKRKTFYTLKEADAYATGLQFYGPKERPRLVAEA